MREIIKLIGTALRELTICVLAYLVGGLTGLACAFAGLFILNMVLDHCASKYRELDDVYIV